MPIKKPKSGRYKGNVREIKYRKEFADMGYGDFMKLPIERRLSIIESMRTEVNRRSEQFAKRNLYSHGLEALDRRLENAGYNRDEKLFKNNRKTFRMGEMFDKKSNPELNVGLYFNYMQEFLDPKQTKTNSVSGIYKVNREQDIRLGFKLKNDERLEFWQMVDIIRSSDVVKPADHYFYKDRGYLRVWRKYRKTSPAILAQAIYDYLRKRDEEYMSIPFEDSGIEVEASSKKSVFTSEEDKGYVDYFSAEIRRKRS